MDIDWSELARGVDSEFEKTAAVNWKPWVKAAPVVGAGIYAGNKALNWGSNALSQGADMLGSVAPLGMALALGAGRSPAGSQTAPIVINNREKPQSILNYDQTGVNSLNSPSMGYGHPSLSKQSFVIDSLANAVRTQIAKKVIDEVSDTPRPQEHPELKKKELEITSEHPEMAKLLENEQNKAYLDRLLKAEM